MSAELDTWIPFAVAIGIGLLIGLERERHKGDGPAREPAGIRTFAIAALLGALTAQLHVAMLALAFGAVAVWLAISHYRRGQTDPGLTTEVALLATLALGALTHTRPELAAGLGVAVAILLAIKQPLHHFARRVLTTDETHDLLLLAGATLIVLPLLPNRGLGPDDAINPANVWTLVILIMAIGGAGHALLRGLGSRLGLPLAGLLGGFVSSTATIAAMGGRARETPALHAPAVAAAALSTVATFGQMVAVLALVDLPTLRVLLPALVAGALVAVLYGAWFTWRSWRSEATAQPPRGKAFRVSHALLLGLLIATLQALAAVANDTLGDAGLTLLNALAGFGDTHAPAAAAAALAAAGRLTPEAVALPILAAFSTNSLSKMLVAALAGGRHYSLAVIPGLVLVLLATWLAWWLTPLA